METEEAGIKRPQSQYCAPSFSTVSCYTAVVLLLVAIIIPFEFHYGTLSFYKHFDLNMPLETSIKDYVLINLGMKEADSKRSSFDLDFQKRDYANKEEQILSKAELKKYTGNSKIRYLAIVGQVFDVTKGVNHYGEEGGYRFFTGIDASRAFVTGKFDDDGLIDNIEGLNTQDYLTLSHWLSFYHKDYTYIGKVSGFFYDEIGNEKEGIKIFKEGLAKAIQENDFLENDRGRYPECNSRWTQATGTHVWCDTKSGGIERDWTGYPRKYFAPGATEFRCACVHNKYLNNPLFKPYKGCDLLSLKCKAGD